MKKLRLLIREELVNTLFGQPIPKKGEKGYNPRMHDLETVFLNGSHNADMTKEYEIAIFDIEEILTTSQYEPQEIVRLVKDRIRKCKQELRLLEREWGEELKALKKK